MFGFGLLVDEEKKHEIFLKSKLAKCLVPANKCSPALLGCCCFSKSRKHDQLAAKGETLDSAVYKDDPSRYNSLQFTKAFIIHAGCAFSLADHDRVKRCLSTMCPDHLDVAALNAKAAST